MWDGMGQWQKQQQQQHTGKCSVVMGGKTNGQRRGMPKEHQLDIIIIPYLVDKRMMSASNSRTVCKWMDRNRLSVE
jgi:hypothetical protein